MSPAPQSGTCALCLQCGPLRISHLLPAGIYRLLRADQDPNPHPVIVSNDTSIQTAEQTRAPLLCARCEERFNNGGERWIMQNCFRGPGEFCLLDALTAAKPYARLSGDCMLYAGAKIPAINMDAIVYFATSMVWRAAARTWSSHHNRDQVDLGSYREDFRLYLLGENAFPPSAVVWVNIWPAPVKLAFQPRTLPGQGYRHHNFLIPGMTFHVFVGKRLPFGLRMGCAAASPERTVFLSNEMNSAMMRAVATGVVASRAIGNLRR